MADATIELLLYGHAGCCLCDRLADLLQPHLEALRRQGACVELVKRDIADNPVWLEAYRTRIPVLTCSGIVLLEGRPEPDEVAAVIAMLAGDEPRTK